jgi:carboxypeptidase C (cathepsin A)
MVSFALSSHSSSSSSSTPKLSEEEDAYILPIAADFRVQNLGKVVKAFEKFPGRMYAGSLPMDHKSTTVLGANPNGERTGNLNFWLFVPDKIKAENTISAWFNGGPGCSSFSAGVLFENAPITLPLEPAGWCCEEEDTPLTYNKYGWTVATVMLYVEQPIGKFSKEEILNIALVIGSKDVHHTSTFPSVGVGFSEATNDTPPPSHEDDVAADFDSFLQNFFRVFNGYETHVR